MFSPETFALLKGIIDANKASAESYTDAAIETENAYVEDTFWGHSELLLGNETSIQAIEASFTSANNKSIYEGSYTQSSTQGIAWYGYRNTGTTPSKALIFKATSGGTYIGVATRDKDGNWTALKLETF